MALRHGVRHWSEPWLCSSPWVLALEVVHHRLREFGASLLCPAASLPALPGQGQRRQRLRTAAEPTRAFLSQPALQPGMAT